MVVAGAIDGTAGHQGQTVGHQEGHQPRLEEGVRQGALGVEAPADEPEDAAHAVVELLLQAPEVQLALPEEPLPHIVLHFLEAQLEPRLLQAVLALFDLAAAKLQAV